METNKPAEWLVFCPYCGQKLTKQVSFCPKCGKKIVQESKPSPEEHYKADAGENIGESAKVPLDNQPPNYRQEQYNNDLPSYAAPVNPSVFQNIWDSIKSGCHNLSVKISDFISGKYRVKRLYRHWAEHDQLPEESIPPDIDLMRTNRGMPAEASHPLPQYAVVVSLVGLLVLFILIGIWIYSCS
jgi:DNA-directed RNA polymerase subunit RPC12/RpoP